MFGNLYDGHDALMRACFLLKPGRCSHAAGAARAVPLRQLACQSVWRFLMLPPTFRGVVPTCVLPAAACSHLVISHPLGRPWHERFRAANPQLVPQPLPQARGACCRAAAARVGWPCGRR